MLLYFHSARLHMVRERLTLDNWWAEGRLFFTFDYRYRVSSFRLWPELYAGEEGGAFMERHWILTNENVWEESRRNAEDDDEDVGDGEVHDEEIGDGPHPRSAEDHGDHKAVADEADDEDEEVRDAVDGGQRRRVPVQVVRVLGPVPVGQIRVEFTRVRETHLRKETLLIVRGRVGIRGDRVAEGEEVFDLPGEF